MVEYTLSAPDSSNFLLSFFQMIRKSVETRDWLSTIEPRNVRAVMKRVVEDITAIDTQVGLLYEEGTRKAHSSGKSSLILSFKIAAPLIIDTFRSSPYSSVSSSGN